MAREGNVTRGISWAITLVVAVVTALVSSVVLAQAKENDDVQYKPKKSSTGAMAGATCTAAGNQNGVFDPGDSITYPGNFTVAPGASADIDDTDGTAGTFIDGKNAKISSDKGGINVTVVGDPINVSGGDGVLNDTVCKSIVASTGISEGSADVGSSSGDAGGSSGDDGPLANVLPRTGGSLLVVLGALAAVGTGLALLRHRAAGR